MRRGGKRAVDRIIIQDNCLMQLLETQIPLIYLHREAIATLNHKVVRNVMPRVSGLPRCTAPKSYAYSIYFVLAIFLAQKKTSICGLLIPILVLIMLRYDCWIVC